jgi:hypothetical protein
MSLFEFDYDKEDFVQQKYFDILQNVISDLLQGILYLLSKLKEKRESKKNE